MTAVRDVSFGLNEGEMVAYLGPNGAGKSTTVKLICGILTPSRGDVSVLGLNPSRARTKLASQIGAVFGQRSQLLWDLPVEETFRFLSVLYGLTRAKYQQSMALLDSLFGVGPLLKKSARELSLGQRTRCEIACAALHGPKFLVLDEPTIGLDLLVKDQVRKGLLQLNRDRQMTILLASHDLGDVEALCTRAILITEGSLRYDGRLSDLRALAAPARTIEFTLGADAELVRNRLLNLPVSAAVLDGDRLMVSLDDRTLQASDVVGEVLRVADGVVGFRVKEPTLDDALRKLYQETPEGTR